MTPPIKLRLTPLDGEPFNITLTNTYTVAEVQRLLDSATDTREEVCLLIEEDGETISFTVRPAFYATIALAVGAL